MTDDKTLQTCRCRVLYEGRVQGVFFRATAERLSSGHEVDGWVQNQRDGSVLLVVEGPPSSVDAFLIDIRTAKAGNIVNEHISKEPPTGEFRGFVVRR